VTVPRAPLAGAQPDFAAPYVVTVPGLVPRMVAGLVVSRTLATGGLARDRGKRIAYQRIAAVAPAESRGLVARLDAAEGLRHATAAHVSADGREVAWEADVERLDLPRFHAGVTALRCVPPGSGQGVVRGAAGPLGRLAADRHKPHDYTNEERQTAGAVADAIGVALSHQRVAADRASTERSLRAQEQVLQAVIWATDLGVWAWDVARGRVVRSTEAKRQLGYADHELEGTWDEWESRVHLEDPPAVLTHLKSVLDSASDRYESEFRRRHRDGHRVHDLSRARERRDAGGPVQGLVGGHLDVTDFRYARGGAAKSPGRADAQCRRADGRTAGCQERRRVGQPPESGFVANVSHELRTRLHAILSFAQHDVARPGDATKTRQDLKRIRPEQQDTRRRRGHEPRPGDLQGDRRAASRDHSGRGGARGR
jgi:PAS domain S-box-containing protein